MGIDFIRKAAKSFHKGMDQSRIDLYTPDLFTRRPDDKQRSYAASIRAGRKLIAGEKLCVRLHNGKIIAQRDMDVVAQFDSPPAELVAAVEKSYGEACGTVQEVHDIAATAEIAVC